MLPELLPLDGLPPETWSKRNVSLGRWSGGQWQSTDNWRKRGFYAACGQAGLLETVEEDGKQIEKLKYKPYDLRHFFTSVLNGRRTNLKRIQKLMGHEDIKTTLNIYGHLIEQAESSNETNVGLLHTLELQNSCGKSVESPPSPAEIRHSLNRSEFLVARLWQECRP